MYSQVNRMETDIALIVDNCSLSILINTASDSNLTVICLSITHPRKQ